MPILRNKQKKIWVLAPVFGVLLFIILYILAAFFYPGGSQVDTNSKGFSWINNYWCDLLDQNAINGQYNPGSSVAVTGMMVLCFTLSFFWYSFPRQIEFKKFSRLIIQVSGILSMVSVIFLFTGFHDAVINIASLFGLIALVGTFTGLYKKKVVRAFKVWNF